MTQLEKRLERSSLKLNTAAGTTTTTESNGHSSDRDQEAIHHELSVESVVSVHESPQRKEKERDGVKEGEKSTASVINLAELETNSEVHSHSPRSDDCFRSACVR